MTKNLIYIILFAIIMCACKQENNEQQIIGKINGEYIYASDIDKLIQQELFDQLNQIYNIKCKAFDSYIDLKILENESKKHNLSSDEFVHKYVSDKIELVGIDSLYTKYDLDKIVYFHGLDISVLEKNSLDENVKLKFNIKAAVINELLDSLKRSYPYEKYIYPPKSPKISMNGLLAYYRGNLNSKVDFYLISDFDCNKCIESHSLYDSIYNTYKDRVKFGYINFSASPTLAQLACNAANEQGKFWIYHDSLYNQKSFIDSVTVYNLAIQIGLDINKFKQDLFNQKAADEINMTIDKLVEKGVYATPTVIINKRFIYNSASFSEISNLIEQELIK